MSNRTAVSRQRKIANDPIMYSQQQGQAIQQNIRPNNSQMNYIEQRKPITSIRAQSSFVPQSMSQQQQFVQQQFVQPPLSQRQSSFVPQSMSQQQPMIQQQNQYMDNEPSQPNIVQGAKLSIQNAITLITLRLGRIETFIQQLQGTDFLNINNDKIIDENVIKNVLERLTVVEKTTNEKNDFITQEIENMKKELIDVKEGFVLDENDFLTNSNVTNNIDFNVNPFIDDLQINEIPVNETADSTNSDTITNPI
jgi:hypothetical protein